MKPLPGAEGQMVLFTKDYPTLFLYLILTFEQTNWIQYLKHNIYQLPLWIKQSGEVESDVITLHPI